MTATQAQSVARRLPFAERRPRWERLALADAQRLIAEEAECQMCDVAELQRDLAQRGIQMTSGRTLIRDGASYYLSREVDAAAEALAAAALLRQRAEKLLGYAQRLEKQAEELK